MADMETWILCDTDRNTIRWNPIADFFTSVLLPLAL